MLFFHFIGRWIVSFIIPSFCYAVFCANTVAGDFIGVGAYVFYAVASFIGALVNTNPQEIYVSGDENPGEGGPVAHNTKGGYRWKAPNNPAKK